jgi:hypothetical protein
MFGFGGLLSGRWTLAVSLGKKEAKGYGRHVVRCLDNPFPSISREKEATIGNKFILEAVFHEVRKALAGPKAAAQMISNASSPAPLEEWRALHFLAYMAHMTKQKETGMIREAECSLLV